MRYGLLSLKVTILLTCCAMLSVPQEAAPRQSIAQAGTELSSSGAMVSVTPQRTNTYNARDMVSAPKALWTSTKLYAVKETLDFSYDKGNIKFDSSIAIYSKHTAPILVNGLIYFSVTADNGYLMILDSADGKVKERYAVDNSLSPLAIAGDVIYLGASGGKFLTFNTKTKRSVWQLNLKGYSFDHASPLVYGGVVYFSGYKNLSIDSSARPAGIFYAVEAVSGKELWTLKVKGSPTSATLDEGTVCFGDQEKNLIALDSRTEEEKWKGKKLPKAGTTLALDNGTAYFGGEAHSLFAVDLATGDTKWSFKKSKPCRTPVLTDKTIYFGCQDKVIHALDTTTGVARWEYKTPAPIVSLPIVSDSTFYFLDAGAYLHALR